MNNIISFADDTESVRLRRPGSDMVVKIDRALCRPFRSRRHFRVEESVVPAKSAHWYFSYESLARRKTEPLEGDVIEDRSENLWTILEVNRLDATGTWQCVARRYATRFGLDEHVDHLRKAYDKSPAGTLLPGYRVLDTGIAAKFSAATVSLQGDGKETLYALVLDAIEAESGDILRRPDGSLYDIEQIQRPLYENGWTEIRLRRQA